MSTENSLTLEDLDNIPIDWRRDERARLSIQLEPIRECVDAVEKVLPEYKKEIDKRFLALENNTIVRSEEEQSLLDQEYAIALHDLEHDFPQVLRYSLFIYSYSRFEKILLGIANNYRRMRKLVQKPNDLRDNGIRQAQAYLKNVVLIPFPDTETSWQDIIILNLIRNQIVHNEGNLPEGCEKIKDRRTIQNFVKKKKWKNDISIEDDKFELSQRFIILVLVTFNTFFDKLCEVLPEQ